jgi:hypothetical protein
MLLRKHRPGSQCRQQQQQTPCDSESSDSIHLGSDLTSAQVDIQLREPRVVEPSMTPIVKILADFKRLILTD